MSIPEIINSSDDDIFIEDHVKVRRGIHFKEDSTTSLHSKTILTPRKTVKKRKRNNEETNSNTNPKFTKSRKEKPVRTKSDTVSNQESGKLRKISETSDFTDKSNSMNTAVIQQRQEKTSPQLSQKHSLLNKTLTKFSSISKISDFFKPLNVTPEKKDSTEKKQTKNRSPNDIELECSQQNKIEISPGISKKRKRFFIAEDNSKSPQKYCSLKIFQNISTDDDCGSIKQDSLDDDLQIINFAALCETSLGTTTPTKNSQEVDQSSITIISEQIKDNEINNDNIEILCDIFKDVVCSIMKEQMDLESKRHEEGKAIEKLLSEDEITVLQKFCLLKENSCKLYVRMLCRKKDWHRVSGINYKDISDDLEKEFHLLQKENFVNVNIDEEDLQTQINLLNVGDILKLCKKFKVPCTSQNKHDRLCSLIENCKKQRGALDLFNKGKSLSRFDMLKNEVTSALGMCIKLNESVMSAFQKAFLLFSFPHYYEEEGKRLSNQLYMCFNVRKRYTKFPQYDLSPTVVFECRHDFLQYEKSLLMNDSLDIAISSKNHEDFFSIANTAKCEFQNILKDNDFQERFLKLQTFLRKFSAGSIYARILTKYCNNFKRKSDNKEVINITKMLLNQNLFLTRKRGEWYEILSQALVNVKDNKEAMKVLIESQKDSFVSEVQKFSLQLKGQSILKKNLNDFQDIYPKEDLDLFSVYIQEPSNIEIKCKLLEGNKSGYKSVFVEESEGCKLYTSVEERALSYYKSIGFTKGYHEENYIVKAVYFLLFFDIIYGPSPPGAFQTYYQEVPLDFYSNSFYSYRKESIDLLLNEMCNWTKEEVEEKLMESYNKNFNVSCMINWRKNFTPKLFAEFLECITMPLFVHICRRFIENFKVYNSGFPDLTLWNPISKKCKFVEVKGPKDKLSPAQRIWLNYLKLNGIDCEVCYIKAV